LFFILKVPPSEYSLYQQIVINCQIHRFAAATGTSGRNSSIRCIPAPVIRRCNKRQIRLASFQLADISLRNAGSPGQRFLRQFRPQCTILFFTQDPEVISEEKRQISHSSSRRFSAYIVCTVFLFLFSLSQWCHIRFL
jgi:hypothetical protein